MQNHSKLDYNRITDHIFVGTNACCKAHFEKELIDKGVEADISLENDRVDAPFGIDYFLWLPTVDHTAPSPEQLRIGIMFIEQCVAMNKKIYIHCRNGHGRAPTLVTAYLITKKSMSADDAIAFIKAKRPTMHLEGNQIKVLRDLT